MRIIALVLAVFAGTTAAAVAQQSSNKLLPGDVALSYHWVHSNTQPADCGCFGLNGGGLSASWHLVSNWSAVAESTAGYVDGGPGTGNSLTLVSYLGGVHYVLRRPTDIGSRRWEPFAQLLVGGAHAGGGIAGAGDHAYAFESRVGAGIDLLLSPHLALRMVQADYEATTFANSVNNHQNNLLLGAGVVFRWFHD